MIAIIRTWVHLFWFLFKWGVVPGTVVTIVALPYVYRQVDVEIRDKIRDQFAAHYPGFDIQIRSAVRVEGCGIEVRDFKIRDPRLTGPEAVLVDIEQVSFRCTTDLADFVADRVAIHRVTIQRPTFRVTRTADGSWSFDRLWPLPKFGDGTPDLLIENGTIELVDATKSMPSRWTLRDVNLSIVTRRDETTGQLVRKIEGHLLGDYLDRVAFEGVTSMDSSEWAITGSVAQVDITPEFHQALPGLLAKEATMYAGFRGRASVDFHLRSDPTQLKGFRFEVAGDIEQGRFDDARLPYPITEVRAKFCATPEGFSINDLKAWFGRAIVSLTCYRAGYDANSLWDVDATVKNLQLEPRLVAGLPESLQLGWRKFTPSGRVDAWVKLMTDGHSIRPEQLDITVDCYDIASMYDKFPYQVEGGFGRLTLKNNVLMIHNMQFKGGDDQPIWVNGEWTAPFTPTPLGWVQMEGSNLPMDKRLYDAANEQGKRTMRVLDLSGKANFWARIERKTPGTEPTKNYVLNLCDASICLESFPYPLKNIRGRVERLPDDSWKFTDLQAANGSSLVTALGWMVKYGENDQLLHFEIDGKNVALGDELCKAVSQKPAMGQAWKNIQPSGSVDVDVVFNWTMGEKKLDMVVTATPCGDTVSIEPVSFPYRLEAIHGPMVFRDGHVSFDRFRGRHGSTTVEGKGSCNFLSDGTWELQLEKMEVTDLRLNRELVQACPPQLRKGLTNLNPKGSMYLSHGAFTLTRSIDPNEPPRAKWDVTLGFQQGSVDCGVSLENLNGTMRLVGNCDGKGHWSKGELDIDSLMYKGFQFTEVKGPIWINDDAVFFGSPDYGKKPNPKRQEVGTPAVDVRSLTGKLYEGTWYGTGWVKTSDQVPRYAFGAYLAHGNLARFTKETSPGTQQVTGSFGGQIQINGMGRTLNGLQGTGNLWLRDADIYELPAMVRLLKIVSGREPDGTAFSKADIRFGIRDSRIFLSPIEFNGDAISLLGEGSMDFDSKVNLSLYPIVGRNDIKLPLISPIMGEASRQAMIIHVKGPLSDPEISRDAFPEMKEAISRLQDSVQSAPRTR